MSIARSLVGMVLAASLAGCSSRSSEPSATPAASAAPAASKPLYQMTPQEVDAKLKTLAATANAAPLTDRVVDLARLNIGQPYDIYLLGEAPFETIDPQPVYNLQESDCVVFVEHTLAMAFTPDFPSFLRLLQRIRYTNGEIGVRTRNHYTELDWNVNNKWLVTEITEDVGGDLTKRYQSKIDKRRFFQSRYKIEVAATTQPIDEAYVPDSAIASVKGKLRHGDVFESIKGDANGSGAWAHHLGFVTVTPDGEVHLLHSTEPKVREQTIESYIESAEKREARQAATRPSIPRHKGFKFFRLNEDAMARLKAIDGDATPKVSVPAGSPITFEAFVAQQMNAK